MTALQLIQGLNNALFVLIFGLVAVAAYRHRTRVALDTALFFGALAFLVLETPVAQLLGFPAGGVTTAILALVVVALPYLMLRLLTDFTSVPLLVQSVTLGGMGLFGLAILVAGGSIVTPAASGLVSGATQILALAAAVSWLLGFAPPGRLRRYWQEPELRAFLERASRLPRLPTTDAILRELERGAGDSFGARAAIGLYDPNARVLQFDNRHGALPPSVPEGSRFLAARVFATQEAAFFPDAARAHPEQAGAYRAASVGAVLVAPITAGERRIGILEAFAEQQPVFSSDDLALAQLLADQAAVVLESRALIDEAARVKALEQAARLKEDFLSAAAHDLKTPLTTLLGQAQILEVRFGRASRRGSWRCAWSPSTSRPWSGRWRSASGPASSGSSSTRETGSPAAWTAGASSSSSTISSRTD